MGHIRAAILATAIAASAAGGLAGCGSHHISSSTSASASALAHDPRVVRAEAHWKPIVARCGKGRHWITHPFRSASQTITCAGRNLTPVQRSTAESCVIRAGLHNGIGRGVAAKDEQATVLCLAKVSPQATASPKPGKSSKQAKQ